MSKLLFKYAFYLLLANKFSLIRNLTVNYQNFSKSVFHFKIIF